MKTFDASDASHKSLTPKAEPPQKPRMTARPKITLSEEVQKWADENKELLAHHFEFYSLLIVLIPKIKALEESSSAATDLEELRKQVEEQARLMDIQAKGYENDPEITDKRYAGLYRAKQSAYDTVIRFIDSIPKARAEEKRG